MAGFKEWYVVQYSDGTLNRIEAQGFDTAKRNFQIKWNPPPGECIRIWRQDEPPKMGGRVGNYITSGIGCAPVGARARPETRRQKRTVRAPAQPQLAYMNPEDQETREEQLRTARAIQQMSPAQFRAMQADDYDDEWDDD
jgi:hypothetical protein